MGGHLSSGPHVGAWVAERVKGNFHPGHATAIGWVKDGKVTAGVMYENWNGRSIMAHIAVEGRLTPAFIAAVFDYAFNVCGVEKAVVPVGSHNVKSQRLVEHMGFAEECRLKDVQPLGDTILYTMQKAQCRFLGEKYGQRIRAIAA